MRMNAHGGRCCGMRHIHNFGGEYLYHYFDEEEKKRIIKALDKRLKKAQEICNNGYHGGQLLLEIILTYTQLKKSGGFLKTLLEERGFKKVNEFKNTNTTNMCYIYHKILDSEE